MKRHFADGSSADKAVGEVNVFKELNRVNFDRAKKLEMVLRDGLYLVENVYIHAKDPAANYGGPTREDVEKWIKKAKEVLAVE